MQNPGSGPLSGSYTATPLRTVRYGPDVINDLYSVMQDILPKNTKPKAFILTGKSLAKTPVIPQIEDLLKKEDAHATTFTKMRQHSPIEDIEEALEQVRSNNATLLIGVGGGSSIDACKTISYFHNERHGSFLPHIAVPTTLSAAEFTQLAGHTDKEGNKTGVMAEEICPSAIILDPKIALYTPEKLWLSTGIRALDHALENLYRPSGHAQYPHQQLALSAVRDLFTYLPQCMSADGRDVEARGKLQVAAWMSLFPARLDTALGPSHALGHALGATYSIPHGMCSVLTLPGTVRKMAKTLPAGMERSMLANAAGYIPALYVQDHMNSNADSQDSEQEACLAVAAALDQLIAKLNLKTTLSEYKVPKEDLAKVAATAYKSTTGKPGWSAVCPSEEEIKEILEREY